MVSAGTALCSGSTHGAGGLLRHPADPLPGVADLDGDLEAGPRVLCSHGGGERQPRHRLGSRVPAAAASRAVSSTEVHEVSQCSEKGPC